MRRGCGVDRDRGRGRRQERLCACFFFLSIYEVALIEATIVGVMVFFLVMVIAQGSLWAEHLISTVDVCGRPLEHYG